MRLVRLLLLFMGNNKEYTLNRDIMAMFIWLQYNIKHSLGQKGSQL